MIAIYWLIGIIVLLIIEVLTMGLTTVWFAGRWQPLLHVWPERIC